MEDQYILIVGGAGYIGSHVNKLCHARGYRTIIIDNLVNGHEAAIKWGRFIKADLSDVATITQVFRDYRIAGVMHFAAYAYVGESVFDPAKYYENNVANTLHLLRAMKIAGCNFIIFSSTCATYGNPEYLPIDEAHPQNPINPYGHSKKMVEQILKDYSSAYDLRYVALRYFNAAGADEAAEIGESHNPETHLIPLILDVALGKKASVDVYGIDYPTKDGSAVRDYIHVSDLADAHLKAMEYLFRGGESTALNLANGDGYSVMEVIEAARHVTAHPIPIRLCDRRPGDPPALIGNSDDARLILGWQPQYPDLGRIVSSAWNWHKGSL
jgi:UDP-glucose 4-epimerase